MLRILPSTHDGAKLKKLNYEKDLILKLYLKKNGIIQGWRTMHINLVSSSDRTVNIVPVESDICRDKSTSQKYKKSFEN